MLFSKILLASLVGAASAVSIPEGTEEGIYDDHVDANGNDVFVKLANATDYSGKELSPYSPRPSSAASSARKLPTARPVLT